MDGGRRNGVALALSGAAFALQSAKPNNSLPNPYQSISDWRRCPTAAIGLDRGCRYRAGRQERLGRRPLRHQHLRGSNLDPILKFDTSGKLVKSFGKGKFRLPARHLCRSG